MKLLRYLLGAVALLMCAAPAYAVPINTVGSNIVALSVAQTVTAGSAYTSGNAIGALMTLPTATNVNAGSGLVQAVVEYTKSAQTSQTDVFLFSANPTSSTCSDKVAFALNVADYDKVIGVIHMSDFTSGGTPSFGQAQNLAMPFTLASGTAVYACAVTRGTPTFTATTDVTFGFRIIRN